MTNYYSFLVVKLLAIVYFSLFYFIIGFIASLGLNKLVSKEEDNEESEKGPPQDNILRLLLESILVFSVVSLIFYFLRKIIKHIPFPLEGISGFQTKKLKELNGVALLAPIFMTYQVNFVEKLSKIKKIMKL